MKKLHWKISLVLLTIFLLIPYADEIGTDLTYEYVETRGFILEEHQKSRSQKSQIPKFKRFL